MQITITYSAPDFDSFVRAVEWARDNAPSATITTIAPSATPRSMRAPDKGSAYATYCATLGVRYFKRTAGEHRAGLTLEQAAIARMQVPGWESTLPPRDNDASEGESAIDDTPPPDIPHDGTPLF